MIKLKENRDKIFWGFKFKEVFRNLLAILWTAFIFALYRYVTGYLEKVFWSSLFRYILFFSLIVVGIHLVLKYIPSDFKEKAIYIYQTVDMKISCFLKESYFFPVIWILLIIAYVPVYLAFFPGILGYDVPIQLEMFYGYLQLTSENPLMHTLLVGTFVQLGYLCFDSYQTGFAIYSAFQGLVVTGSIAFACSYLRKRRVPILVILIGIAYFIFNPLLKIIAFNATKDVLFGAFILCFVVSALSMLDETKNSIICNVRLCIFGVLVCVFRNAGIYLVLCFGVSLLILQVPKKKIIVLTFLAFIIAEAFLLTCSLWLKIPKGDLRENLSVPIQQMAYVANRYLDGEDVSITQEQLEILEEVIPEEGLRCYSRDTVDLVKVKFNTNVFKAEAWKYVKNYFEVGKKNLSYYKTAWFRLIYPYWFINTSEYLGLVFTNTFPERNHWNIEPVPILETYRDNLLINVLRINAEDMRLWEHPEYCLWMLALLSGIAIKRGSKKIAVGILPYIFYFVGMLCGPMALFRYLYPLTLATPFLLGLFFIDLFRESKYPGAAVIPCGRKSTGLGLRSIDK